MFFWNSLAFSMIQRLLEIGSPNLIPIYIYTHTHTHTHHIFTRSFVDGHLGCFHILTIVNSATSYKFLIIIQEIWGTQHEIQSVIKQSKYATDK